MSNTSNDLNHIAGLRRIETFSRDEMGDLCLEWTHAVYPHEQVFGTYCTIEEYIDCPPDDVFRYLADVRSLEEWTWSTRGLEATDDPTLVKGWDRLEDDTRIFCRTYSNEDARTVDYHCAWDQGDALWMIYLMRVVPAELVLGKPGSVVLWSNCRHPNYGANPRPDAAPPQREVWVGDLWPFFYAGHVVEMKNLKAILEHRHAEGLPIVPWEAASAPSPSTALAA